MSPTYKPPFSIVHRIISLIMFWGKGPMSYSMTAASPAWSLPIASNFFLNLKRIPGMWVQATASRLLGSQTARQGWAGLEFASGIPGSVGGAVYMNAGANGCETCETLLSVDYVTPEGTLLCLTKEELVFSYRHSSFQKMKGAIAGATFKVVRSQEARQKQLSIIDYRKKTQPYDAKSAGCVFRNPECAHAGALIDQCGLKGKTIGGAQVSTLHANFLINAGGATSADILKLIQYVQQDVKEKKGIDLEHEVRCVPYSLTEGPGPLDNKVLSIFGFF